MCNKVVIIFLCYPLYNVIYCNSLITGQFYSVYFRGNTSMSLSESVKSVIYLTFFDEPDRRVEYNHWKYWYDLQANPNQRAFDIGMYMWMCACVFSVYCTVW